MTSILAPGLLCGTALLALGGPLRAQDRPAFPASGQVETGPAVDTVEPDDEFVGEGIVITGRRLAGEVDTQIPVELELDEQAIASYGASSIGDLLAALGPQTGSARGRGGGQPVVLINGQRVSGFRELRDLPPEAILRVQVFPEELALQYGYRPDQRVINFILKPDFRSLALEAGYGFATSGGYEINEVEATLTRITKTTRLNLDVDFEPTSGLLQFYRGLIPSRTDALGLVDEGRFRTLLPSTDPLELTATASRNVGSRTSLSLTGEYARTTSLALLGLPPATLTVPGTSPFSRTGLDETIVRLLPGGGGLARRLHSDAISLGATLNGQWDDWRWATTATYNNALTRIATERQPSTEALGTAVAAGDPSVDPFSAGFALTGPRTIDTARSRTQAGVATSTINGSPLRLPAGEVQLTLTAQGEAQGQDSRSTRAGLLTASDLTRQSALARANLVLPISSRREGVLDALGTLSFNANIGYTTLSDFGGLTEYGYGLVWQPVEKLSLIASVIDQQAAPGLNDLGAPQLLTPQVPVFDGTVGRTVFADVLTGGNLELRRESRRDLKLSATYSPGERGRSSFVIEYLRNRSDNVTAAFPLLTPAIEAAFPDRVSRDATGALLRLDSRPVTFDRLRSDRLRFGFSLSGSLGPEPDGVTITGGGGGRPGRGRQDGSARRSDDVGSSAASASSTPPGREERPATTPTEGVAPATDANPPATPAAEAARPARPAGFGGGRGFGGRGRGRGGRWNLSIYDVWQLNNRVLIRPGVPELDLLGGDVTDGSTPVSRHQVQLEGGLFKDGLGLRMTGAYTGRAILSDGGTGLSAGSATDLRFGDLFTLSARVFVDFDQRQTVLDAVPFLKASRLSVRVDNLFGSIRRVTDPFGATPLAYQPGFLDPRGRYLEVSLRKRF